MSAEVSTALSDLVLAVLAMGMGVTLFIRRGREHAGALWVAGFLIATAVAAALGATWHSGHDAMSPTRALMIWRFTLLSVGLANSLLLTGVAYELGPTRRDHLIDGFIVAKVVIYAVLIFLSDSFLPAVGDQVLTEIAVGGMIIWDSTHGRRLPAGRLLLALVLGLLSGVVQIAGVGFGAWFNHNTLYHLIGIGSLAAFAAAGDAMERKPRLLRQPRRTESA